LVPQINFDQVNVDLNATSVVFYFIFIFLIIKKQLIKKIILKKLYMWRPSQH